MVYCVQGRLGFSTSARRTAVMNAITTALSGKARWGTDEAISYNATPRIQSPNARMFSYRFTTRANADAFYTSLLAALVTTTPMLGSWVTKHDCNSDGQGACVQTARTDW